jgi:hypothetical protein
MERIAMGKKKSIVKEEKIVYTFTVAEVIEALEGIDTSDGTSSFIPFIENCEMRINRGDGEFVTVIPSMDKIEFVNTFTTAEEYKEESPHTREELAAP